MCTIRWNLESIISAKMESVSGLKSYTENGALEELTTKVNTYITVDKGLVSKENRRQK